MRQNIQKEENLQQDRKKENQILFFFSNTIDLFSLFPIFAPTNE
jgi:hypothetical protein